MAQSNFKNRTLWNLQLLCGACNSDKGTKTQEEFLVALRGR